MQTESGIQFLGGLLFRGAERGGICTLWGKAELQIPRVARGDNSDEVTELISSGLDAWPIEPGMKLTAEAGWPHRRFFGGLILCSWSRS
jgi:hypothetical protein